MRQYHYLGLFESADDAHLAWIAKKLTYAYQFKEMCNLISPWLFEALITRVLALSNAPSKYEIAERISEEIETAEHIEKFRSMRRNRNTQAGTGIVVACTMQRPQADQRVG